MVFVIVVVVIVTVILLYNNLFATLMKKSVQIDTW